MFMKRNHLVSNLRAEAPTGDNDNPNAHQLTIIFNESNWGQRWKATIPKYDDVKSFRKHLLSLCCVTLKGFKKCSFQHVSHLVPQVHTKFWIRGLLENLLDSEMVMIDETTGPTEKPERMLQLLGCSKVVVQTQDLFEMRWIERISGRSLAKKLMELNINGRQLKVPPVRPDVANITIAFNV